MALLAALLWLPSVANGADHAPAAHDVILAGDQVTSWKEDNHRFFLLEGNGFIEQGLTRIRARNAIAWLDDDAPQGQPTTIHVMTEGTGRVEEQAGPTRSALDYETTLTTTKEVRVQSRRRVNSSKADHPLYRRAATAIAASQPASPNAEITQVAASPAADQGGVVAATGAAAGDAGQIAQAQFQSGGPVGGSAPPPAPRNRRGTSITAIAPSGGQGGAKRVSVSPRNTQPYHSDSYLSPDGSRTTVFTGGINLIIEDLGTGQMVDIVADRVVLWTRGDLAGPIAEGAQAKGDQPLECYLEGNVYIRQGNPRNAAKNATIVLSGKQVYYNANTNQALILDGSVETMDPKLKLPLYVKSEEIRQLTPDKFYADRASVTTSVHRGTPGYEFTASEVYFEEIKQRVRNPFTGQEVMDPETGQPLERARHYATTYSDVLRINGVPVFYWPYLRLDVEDPLGPIQQIRLGNSRVLGFISALSLDMWQLLGLDYLDIADQTNWLADVGYFSKRGISGGTRFNYFGGAPGAGQTYYGDLLIWGIEDHGLDYLGIDRNGLTPVTTNRGRIKYQHRQEFANDLVLQLEASFLSDNNFLESFYEVEYDTGKDQDTLVYLKQARNQWGWSVLAQPRVANFLPQNPALPRGDFHTVGLPLLGDRLTYFGHSSAGYFQLRPPNRYNLPTDVTLDTGRLDSRHEINLPVNFGAWQVTPFAVGELTGYTDGIDTATNTATGESLGRTYAAGGVRTSLPFWKIYPNVQSDLWNLNGLAHKVAFDVDYLYGYSNQFFRSLPYLDQLDDDTSELVRRQNLIRSQAQLISQFGSAWPLQYDPRTYANRANVNWFPEALDNMQNVRFGLNQNLQTKRGPIGNTHLVNWMTFDASASLFPQKDRDNFGYYWGLINYYYQWNIGDRTSLMSTFLYEPFDDTYTISGAVNFQRPPRTMFSIFTSNFSSGPFVSNYIGGSVSYRMSQKYAGSFAMGNDVSAGIAPSVTAGFTRIGLDFITTLGIVYNSSRRDFGFQFEIYPKAQGRTRFARSRLNTLPFGLDASDAVAPAVVDRLSVLNNTLNPY